MGGSNNETKEAKRALVCLSCAFAVALLVLDEPSHDRRHVSYTRPRDHHYPLDSIQPNTWLCFSKHLGMDRRGDTPREQSTHPMNQRQISALAKCCVCAFVSY